MIQIVVYSTLDGMIAKCCGCGEEMADLQCGEDQAWLEHEMVDDSQFKVDLETLTVVAIESTSSG